MSKKNLTITKITDPICLGEGPHWRNEDKSLFLVDISGKSVLRYHPESDNVSSVKLNDTIGAVIPIKGQKNKFVIGLGRNISILTWDWETGKHSVETKFTVENDKPNNRFNDGKADSRGRLWIGTMSKKHLESGVGCLYRVDGEIKQILDGITISNGLAWSLDDKLMYYIDSALKKIDVFDYDIKTGDPSGRRTFFSFEDNNVKGLPDGMTIDKNGNLWVACWSGSQVIKISSDGKLLDRIELPSEHITSVTWGGNDLSTLYVTSMYEVLDEENRKKQPLAGTTWAIKGLGTSGNTAHEVSI